MGTSQIRAMKKLISNIKSETEFMLNELERKITLKLKLDIPAYYVIFFYYEDLE